MTSQFDYYNGGNLDLTCLGFAEVDSAGNVNVSRFGTRIAGCGGLVDISQSTHTVVFCGTMTAGGLKEKIEDGKLVIVQEGKKVKFKKSVEQITFSAEFSKKHDQRVLFITERCVFQVTDVGSSCLRWLLVLTSGRTFFLIWNLLQSFLRMFR